MSQLLTKIALGALLFGSLACSEHHRSSEPGVTPQLVESTTPLTADPGEKGDKGETGDKGAKGEQGDEGAAAKPCTLTADEDGLSTLSCPGSDPVKVLTTHILDGDVERTLSSAADFEDLRLVEIIRGSLKIKPQYLFGGVHEVLPNLRRVTGHLTIEGDVLSDGSIKIPALEKVDGGLDAYFPIEVPDLRIIGGNAFIRTGGGTNNLLGVDNCGRFLSLSEVVGTFTFSAMTLSNRTCEFPSLHRVGALNMLNTAANFPSLSVVNGPLTISGDVPGEQPFVDFPTLREVRGLLTIANLSKTREIGFPVLNYANGGIEVLDNGSLTSLVMPRLETVQLWTLSSGSRASRSKFGADARIKIVNNHALDRIDLGNLHHFGQGILIRNNRTLKHFYLHAVDEASADDTLWIRNSPELNDIVISISGNSTPFVELSQSKAVGSSVWNLLTAEGLARFRQSNPLLVIHAQENADDFVDACASGKASILSTTRAVQKALAANSCVAAWESLLARNTLDLSDTGITDVSPLEGLRLWNLNLAGNFIKDLDPIARIRELSQLDLSRNPIENLSPLAGSSGLSEIKLDDTPIVAKDFLLTEQNCPTNPPENAVARICQDLRTKP